MSNEPKLTPGPWKYNTKTREIGVVDTSDTQSYGMMLVVAHIDEHDHAEYETNGHLIAAAPVMYEELESLRDWLDGMNVTGKYDGTVAGIDMVLNIARGEK